MNPRRSPILLEYLEYQSQLEVIVFSGGTGIAPRDTTYDVVSSWLTKIIPGFGEIFRYLSYQEIGSRAISSRAVAGVRGQILVFSLPGSSNAVQLGMSQLILPELNHLIKQIQGKKIAINLSCSFFYSSLHQTRATSRFAICSIPGSY